MHLLSSWVCRESGGIIFAILLVINATLTQGFRVAIDYWLGLWSSDHYHASSEWYMMIFGLLGLCQCLLVFSNTMQFAHVCTTEWVGCEDKQIVCFLDRFTANVWL